MQKIGFIGVGNMGGALASAVCKTISPDAVYLADTFTEKMQAVAAQTGAVVSDAKTVAATCDYIFLGVKPQMLSALFDEIGASLRENPNATLISMAAGIPLARIAELSGATHPVIRIMPNTPVAIGEGMIVYTPNAKVTAEQTVFFKTMLCEAGVLLELPEEQMDAACAVSGCGPAFVYMFIDALIRGGVESGLPKACAEQLASQTVLGATCLLQQSGKQPDELKEAVCSPGGSTIEGVHTLESADFYRVVSEAVKTSYKRAKELSNM